jgi:hypothetical protein
MAVVKIGELVREVLMWWRVFRSQFEAIKDMQHITLTAGNERFLSKSSVECRSASNSEANDKSASSVIVLGAELSPVRGKSKLACGRLGYSQIIVVRGCWL